MSRLLITTLFVCLFCGALQAQPMDESFIYGKIKYYFNFEEQKLDSLQLDLMSGDSLVMTTYSKKGKYQFNEVKAGEYTICVKIPDSKKFCEKHIPVTTGKDGFALPAKGDLEFYDVNLDGLEPEEADRIRELQVKFEKKQARK